MGVIQQVGQFSGNPYSFTIAGDTPTEQEAARISQILDQQESPYRQRYESQYGGIASLSQPVEEEVDTSIGGALLTSLDQPLEGFATTARLTGFEGTADFLSGLTEAPEGYESATEKFLNEEGTGFRFGYAPRAVVEQAGQFAGSLLSRAAGAGIGGLVGGVPGAVAGGISGPVLFEAVQLLGPIAEERARNNGREVPNRDDWLGALSSSSASGALNAIAPGMSGFLKKVVVEAGTEGLQSVIQQAGETALTEKGLEIKPKQAIGEAILGGGAAGVISGPIELVKGKPPKESDIELEQDLREFEDEARERLGYSSQISQDLAADAEAQAEAAINSENPEAKQTQEDPMSFSEITTEEEFADTTFNKAQYDRVLQQIKADIEREKALSITGIHQNVKKDIKDTKVSQVRDIMGELANRGYLQAETQQPTVRDRATGVRYTPAPQYQATRNIVPQLKTPDVSYRRQIDIANEAIAKNNKIMEDLKLDLDSVRQYGRDLQGKRTSENAINYEIDRLNKRNVQYNQVVGDAQQGLQRLGRLPYVPRVTPEFNRSQKIERKVAAAKARSVADQVKEKVQSNKPVFTPALTEKQDKVFKSIRERLDGYGLKDVRLNAEQVVDGGEGSYNPTGRVISLSMGLYDPNLSETELFDRVGEVLDHETTHALKEMNVITPSEWKTLSNAASKLKYTKVKGGEAQQRKYSYLDRAKRLYSDMDAEIQAEEAVAEMFRDYNAGRLKLTGKPKGLFTKIKNFFKSIVGGAVDNGFTDVQSIFDEIVVGNIGQRERGMAAQQQTEPAARQSRIFATEEEIKPLQEIRMPINVAAPNDQVRADIQRMTNQNRPVVKRLIKPIDDRYGTKSGENAKYLS